MSNDNNEGKNKVKVDKILTETIMRRRAMQLQELKIWDAGRSTSRQCIENILDIEKIIFFNNRGVPNG